MWFEGFPASDCGKYERTRLTRTIWPFDDIIDKDNSHVDHFTADRKAIVGLFELVHAFRA